MIDSSKIKYNLIAILPNGGQLKLDNFLRTITLSESDGELAARMEAEIQNQKMDDGTWLHQKLQLNGKVVLMADWGEGLKEVFRGTIFDWDYNTDPLGHFTITAYDDLIYLTKSSDDKFYKAGQTAKGIIEDIAKSWSIPLGKIDGPNVAVGKQVFRGDTLADMIKTVLDEAKSRGAGKWIVRSSLGKIEVVKPGQNSPVYLFTADENVESINDRQSIENLVTRVKIYGGEDAETKAPLVAQIDGKTEFGVLQEVIYQRQYDTPAAAKSAAQEILKERGSPEKTRKVIAADVPFLRKGDKVKISAGTLIGYYIVSGVSHNITQGIMSMEVEDIG
ncbi:XkdQ/YqbQ family protein [Tepidanaerobacter syntrophicus]|uniref:XkdQ/YqbQ family protein n=1 Tax=Tepidanaerobacter syntrophicus TaxID=224999 RepID=UPI001BD3F8C2|nr:hypothetical protein [Tepidanaerobacter syntrophicus]